MDAYVINLKKRKDRWNEIQDAFRDSGIKLHRIDGVEHRNGSYGCAMSHLKVIEMAKKKNMSSVLVLEDDCLPGDNFKERWPRVKKWLDEHPDDWDIFNGGGSATGHVDIHHCDDREICLFKASGLFHAHFIYVPKRMYDRVLEFPNKEYPYENEPDKNRHHIPKLIDVWYNQNFNTLSIYPFLGKTKNGFSNIEKIDRTNISDTFKISEQKYKNVMKSYKKGGRWSSRKRKRSKPSQQSKRV